MHDLNKKKKRKYQMDFEERIQDIAPNYVSYMNNTKWRKYFTAIQESDIPICYARVKVLGRDEDERFSSNPGLDPDVNYTRDGFELPFWFFEIEWIFIPNNDENGKHIQAIKELLGDLGQFEYDFDEAGLKIYGYKPLNR